MKYSIIIINHNANNDTNLDVANETPNRLKIMWVKKENSGAPICGRE